MNDELQLSAFQPGAPPAERDLIVSLYVQGYMPSEIAKHLKLSTSDVRAVLSSKSSKELIQQLREELEDSWLNLGAKALQAVRDALDQEEPRLRLDAASLYLKHFKSTTIKLEFSAEDLIQQILQANQAQAPTYEVEPTTKEE